LSEATIEIRGKQLLIDGQPSIVLAGEVHYFRLARDQWADRVDKLKAAGANAVASYIPWLWHEMPDGSIDVTGKTRPERDVGAFIDLCRDRGLWFFARPGPFVMAELKNEGLPFRLYEEHPEIVPVTWDGKPAPTSTIDYLAPAFLAEARRWYGAVMPVIAARLQPQGGNVIAVQLDNEVGMLSWVSNAPDLTDGVLDDFARWLRDRYGVEPAGRYGLAWEDAARRNAALRAPDDGWAARYLRDLGHYMRDRFARYIRRLRGYAEEHGVTGVPFVVNIHGTVALSAAPFPVGISQLADTYRGIPGMLSGSDIYLGDLTSATVHGLYLANAFMDAVHDEDQPITSVEFEAGSGNYGGDFEPVYDASAIDLKTRLCIAQGARMLSYYLFAGGINPRLETPADDGNDRIGTEGERHGFAAPVNPEGETGTTYQDAARAIRAIGPLAGKLATMRHVHDDLTLAFVPDYFMTESCYPGSTVMTSLVADLERYRGGGAREGAVVRALLRAGYRFGATDLQHGLPGAATVLVLPSARHLDRDVQRRVAEFVRGGGRLLLTGRLPTHDMEDQPCTTLADALGLAVRAEVAAGPHRFPSVCASGWAAPRPEVRVSALQLCEAQHAETILYDYASGLACGFDIRVGAGHAIVVTADYPCDVTFFSSAMERLGVRARLRCDTAGPFAALSANDAGERIVHTLNLTAYEQSFRLELDGSTLFGGHPVTLPPRQSAMLPVGMTLGGVPIAWATCEPVAVCQDRVTFRSAAGGVIAVEPGAPVQASAGCAVTSGEGCTLVHAGENTSQIDIWLDQANGAGTMPATPSGDDR
jgi:beta-galactosidase